MPPFEGYTPSDAVNPELDIVQAPESGNSVDEMHAMQADLRAKLDDLKHSGLKNLAQDEFGEFQSAQIERQGEVDAISQARLEFLDDMKGLNSVEANYGDFDNFDVFVGMMGEIPDAEREQILALFSNPRLEFDIEDYMYDNGMPNQETKAKFYQTFGIQEGGDTDPQINPTSVRELNGLDNTIETQEQIDAYMELNSQIQSLDASFPGNLGIRWNDAMGEMEESGNPRKVTDLLHAFKVEGKFATFMDTIRFGGQVAEVTPEEGEGGEDTGSETVVARRPNPAGQRAYESLKGLAVSTDASLSATFAVYEQEPRREVAPVTYRGVVTRGVTDGGDYDIDGDGTLTGTGADGESEVTIDLTDIPATGTMSLPGSDYSVPVEMEITPEMQDSVATFERTRLATQTKITKLENAIAFIGELPENAPIDEVKDRLRQDILGLTLYSELGVDKAESIDQLKTLLVPYLGTRLAEYNKELEDAQQQYNDDMSEMTGAYREAMIQRHRRKLDFLRDAGVTHFDLIDQSITNQLAEEINRNKGAIKLGNGLTLNTDIDFAEGIFGYQDGMDGNSSREREAFIRFVNLLATGNPEGLKDSDNNTIGLPVDAYVLGNTPVSDTDMVERVYKREGGIMNASGTWNIEQMRRNLGLV